MIGIIATNWLFIADKSQQGIFDPDCLKLARLHSDAVDYPKSGRPITFEEIPVIKEKRKPDWYAPEFASSRSQMSYKFYESQRALGLLYRNIKLPDLNFSEMSISQSNEDDDEEILFSMSLLSTEERGHNSELYQKLYAEVSKYIDVDTNAETMTNLFNVYAAKLRPICQKNTLSRSRWGELTEEEALIGTIVAKCSQPRRRDDLMSKLREETNILVKEVKHYLTGDDGIAFKEKLKRAWQAWEIALVQRARNVYGAKSFWWICLSVIFDYLREAEEESKEHEDIYLR